MALPPNVREYYEQLVKTATKGNVEADFSLFTHRMKLTCVVCGVTLTAKEPESVTEVDYSVQEFIKIHSHQGGHCAHEWYHLTDKPLAFSCKKCGKGFDGVTASPTAVTADFKKVQTLGEILDLDKKLIDAQAAKYAKEMQDTATLEAKGKLLQLKSQIDAINKVTDDTIISSEASAEMIMKLKEEQQALMNILTLKNLKQKNELLSGAISGMHSSSLPKAKKVKIETGRKFR